MDCYGHRHPEPGQWTNMSNSQTAYHHGMPPLHLPSRNPYEERFYHPQYLNQAYIEPHSARKQRNAYFKNQNYFQNPPYMESPAQYDWNIYRKKFPNPGDTSYHPLHNMHKQRFRNQDSYFGPGLFYNATPRFQMETGEQNPYNEQLQSSSRDLGLGEMKSTEIIARERNHLFIDGAQKSFNTFPGIDENINDRMMTVYDNESPAIDVQLAVNANQEFDTQNVKALENYRHRENNIDVENLNAALEPMQKTKGSNLEEAEKVKSMDETAQSVYFLEALYPKTQEEDPIHLFNVENGLKSSITDEDSDTFSSLVQDWMRPTSSNDPHDKMTENELSNSEDFNLEDKISNEDTSINFLESKKSDNVNCISEIEKSEQNNKENISANEGKDYRDATILEIGKYKESSNDNKDMTKDSNAVSPWTNDFDGQEFVFNAPIINMNHKNSTSYENSNLLKQSDNFFSREMSDFYSSMSNYLAASFTHYLHSQYELSFKSAVKDKDSLFNEKYNMEASENCLEDSVNSNSKTKNTNKADFPYSYVLDSETQNIETTLSSMTNYLLEEPVIGNLDILDEIFEPDSSNSLIRKENNLKLPGEEYSNRYESTKSSLIQDNYENYKSEIIAGNQLKSVQDAATQTLEQNHLHSSNIACLKCDAATQWNVISKNRIRDISDERSCQKNLRNRKIYIDHLHKDNDTQSLQEKATQDRKKTKLTKKEKVTKKVEISKVKDTKHIMKDEVPVMKDEVSTMKDKKEILKDKVTPYKDKQILKDEVPTVKDKKQILKDTVPTVKDKKQILKDTVPTVKDKKQILKDTVPTMEDEKQTPHIIRNDATNPKESFKEISTSNVRNRNLQQQNKEQKNSQKNATNMTRMHDMLLRGSRATKRKFSPNTISSTKTKDECKLTFQIRKRRKAENLDGNSSENFISNGPNSQDSSSRVCLKNETTCGHMRTRSFYSKNRSNK